MASRRDSLPTVVAEALDLLDSGLLQMTADAAKSRRRAAAASRSG